MKLVKDTNTDIISGTEAGHQTDKPTDKEVKNFQQKWQEHKNKYMAEHSTKEMVYENGSALALLYKEVQRMNTLLLTLINKDNDNEKKTTKTEA